MARQKLTKKVIDGLLSSVPGGTRFLDGDPPGFGIKVHPTGRKVFFVLYGDRKRRRAYTIGAYGTLTLKKAREKAYEVLGKVNNGTDPNDERDTVQAMPSFREWVKEYLVGVHQRKKRPGEDDRYLRMATQRWGTRPLDSITTEDVEKFFRQLAADHKTTANRWLASVRACFQYAWRSDKIATNPAMRIRPNPEDPPRARVLSDEELHRFLSAVDMLSEPFERAAFWLLLLTGVRRSELLRARWEDFDFSAKTWRIPSPKAGFPQVIPLPEKAVVLLRGLPRSGSLVIPGRHDPEKPRSDLKGPWEKVRTAAGLDNVRLHDLRRTFGLRVAKSAGLHVASKLLRHGDVRITERVYAPLGLDDLRPGTEQSAADLATLLQFPANEQGC